MAKGFGSVSFCLQNGFKSMVPWTLYARKKNVTVIYGIQIEMKLKIKNDTFGNDESNLCAHFRFGVGLVSNTKKCLQSLNEERKNEPFAFLWRATIVFVT